MTYLTIYKEGNPKISNNYSINNSSKKQSKSPVQVTISICQLAPWQCCIAAPALHLQLRGTRSGGSLGREYLTFFDHLDDLRLILLMILIILIWSFYHVESSYINHVKLFFHSFESAHWPMFDDSWIQVTEKSGFPPAVPPLLVQEYDGAGPPAKQLCILNTYYSSAPSIRLGDTWTRGHLHLAETCLCHPGHVVHSHPINCGQSS